MIDYDHARRIAQGFSGLNLVYRLGALYINGLAVPNKYRHPNTGCLNRNILIENFPRFDGHLPFFLGRPIIHKHIDMRNHIKCYLLGKLFMLLSIVHKNTAGLVKQLVHRLLPRPRR